MGLRFALVVSVVLVGNSPTQAQPRATQKVRIADPKPVRKVNGFRMEGAPAVDIVFGDTETFERHIDKFFVLSEKMTSKRNSFTRFAQASLATLARHPKTRTNRKCPTGALAPYYYRAHTDAEDYRVLGIAFEDTYAAVTSLDRYGETAGLTPVYKWRVAKVRGMYRSALTDYREIQIALLDQLDPEVIHRGCKKAHLFTRAARTKLLPLGESAANTPQPPTRKLRKQPIPILRAQAATFVVDSRDCAITHNVYVGKKRMGSSLAGGNAAFQVLTGNHELCLIPAGSPKTCGSPGTLRKAYIHDGWSLALHCAAPARE